MVLYENIFKLVQRFIVLVVNATWIYMPILHFQVGFRVSLHSFYQSLCQKY